MTKIEQLAEKYNQTVQQIQELTIAKERLYGGIMILQEQEAEQDSAASEEEKEDTDG